MTKLAHRQARAATAPKKTIELTQIHSLKHHTDEVWDVCFSHDATRLASSGADKTTIIYSVETFQVLHKLCGHSGGIGCASWSPDDSKIVTCSQDYTAMVWDTATGTPVATLTGFEGPVTSCVWLPSGQEFVTTALSCPGTRLSLCLWSADGIPICKFPLDAPILGCVLLPDNKIASFGANRRIFIHDLDTKKQMRVKIADLELSSMCASKLGKPYLLLLKSDGLIEMADSKTMEMIKVFKIKSHGTFVIKATFGGENEEFIASGSEEGDIYIWETATGEILLRQSIHNLVSCNSVAWNSKKYGMISTAGDDHTVRILAIDGDDESWEHVGWEEGEAVSPA